ncbi:capsule biosynthesis protein [Plastorhodobacter daqingensis]|uniref:Capsule biosynthesis protein n=1 Tax=Plastorhodobacter daqingensis TaxID=1387281 RepID=A0ABW2UFC4_9RHOB
MTTRPRAKKYRVRLSGSDAAGPGEGAAAAKSAARATQPRKGKAAQASERDDAHMFEAPDRDDMLAGGSAGTAGPDAGDENLTSRQLRMARRLAIRHGIDCSSDLDAVHQLRARGIDPFSRENMLELVIGQDDGAPGTDIARVEGDQLPRKLQPAPPPSPERRAEEDRTRQILSIQRDIARRRQRRMMLLVAQLLFFVFLPTVIAGYYYYRVATPLYSTLSEMVIQQAEGQQSQLGGLFSGTGLATSQDSITVQSYLQSREAMLRLDAELGFKAHFSQESIDPIHRLPADATNEAAYRVYKRMVQIGYDPTEGILKMEVIAADPDVARAFALALISYAEEQVDQLTQRLRADQMSGATTSFEDAEAKMLAAQRRVVELQQSYEVISSEVEVNLLTNQISQLENQLTQERLTLQELLSNPNPNRARVDPLERRIATLESEIATTRARLTQDSATGLSIARIQSELLVAQADVHTRQAMLAQALQQLEAARIEANKQVRYLSLGVSPVAPDEPSYPRAFENTALVFLIFGGIYLMLSMTASILREQVSA